ncbi:hypothetical protein BJ165DRAFT_162542 [Panaeolus papilionaceus]|nr:hypothetical protein BJ165DRAFT_162542 [Panaeolus papilionaceus]
MQGVVSSTHSLQPGAQQTGTIITDLPSELLYNLFDWIYSDAPSPKATMKACRLVCRVLNAHALPYVFRDVRMHLSSPYQDPRVGECVHILEENPKIATCVQKVTISVGPEHYAMPRRGTEMDGIYKNVYLPVILPQFTGMKSFVLKKTQDWIRWTEFSNDIITALEGVFSTASLVSIEIHGVGDFPHLDWIRGLTIERLHLSAVAFQNPEKRRSSSGQFNPRHHTVIFPTLRHLTLAPTPRLLDEFNNLQQRDEDPLPYLQSISLLLSYWLPGKALSRFLDRVSTHLQELELANSISGTACNKCCESNRF